MNDGAPETRRDFLQVVTVSAAVVGLCACAWPFVDSLTPPVTLGDEAPPLRVDLDRIAPGTQSVVAWRGKPIFVVHRTDREIAALRDPALLARLVDPGSKTAQQPDYARNWHRSIDPRFGVYVGICTHLGCIPAMIAAGDDAALYRCPCHGSGFDLAARVIAGSPARLNLPVPPYAMDGASGLSIGPNGADRGFDLDRVEVL